MHLAIAILIFCGLSFNCVLTKKLPSFVTPCKRNDPDVGTCFINVVETLKPYLVKGIPELHLQSIDPMVLEKLTVTNFTGANLGVDAELTNLSLYGGKDFVFKSQIIDFVNKETTTELYIPRIDATTNYRMTGRILFIDLDSKGTAEVKLDNLNVKVVLKAKPYEKDGKEYWKFELKKLDYSVEKVWLHIDNLFPNNPELSENTNKVLNENIDTLIEDIDPILRDTATSVILSSVNAVHDQYSVDELYV